MYKSFALAGVIGALAVPAVAQATETPTSTDRQNAAKECRVERGSTAATREAFTARYGTNHNKHNAFGKCVSAKARDEVKEREDAETGAAKTCRAEQGTTAATRAAFELKYGTNKNKKNAFGKCVSQAAKAAKDAGRSARRRRRRRPQARGEDVRRRARQHRGHEGRLRRQVRHQAEQEERVRQVRLEAGEDAGLLTLQPARRGRSRIDGRAAADAQVRRVTPRPEADGGRYDGVSGFLDWPGAAAALPPLPSATASRREASLLLPGEAAARPGASAVLPGAFSL